MKKTPKTRLLRVVIRRNGVASVREIARAHIAGAVLDDARAQTAGLVVWEQIRRKGRGKRTTVARLTFKGVLEAVRIFPDYTPDFRLLIAETDLRAMLAQAAADHTPLALEIARDREDAGLYRAAEGCRTEAARAAEAKREAREKPAPKYPSAGRNRSPEDLAARRQWAASKGFQSKDDMASDESLNEPAYPIPDIPPLNATPPRPSPTVLRPGSYCERCHFNSELCTCAHPIRARTYTPTIRAHDSGISDGPTGDSSERIKEKARRLGYGAAIMQDGMLYDSKKISFEEWDRKVAG